MGKKLELPKSFKQYRRIFKKLESSAKPNDAILIVKAELRSHGCSGMGGNNREESRDITLTIGILPEKKPFFGVQKKNEAFLIMVPKFLTQTLYLSSQRFTHPGPIVIGQWNLYRKPGEPIYIPDFEHHEQEQIRLGMRKPVYPLEIIVGIEAIQTYCSKDYPDYMDFFIRTAHALNLSYKKPPEVLKKGNEAIRRQVLETILTGFQEEQALVRKINLTKKRCEGDREREFVVESWREREQLESTLKNLRWILKSAVELRMHETPWIVELSTPGATIDVPKLVVALYKKLKIKTNE